MTEYQPDDPNDLPENVKKAFDEFITEYRKLKNGKTVGAMLFTGDVKIDDNKTPEDFFREFQELGKTSEDDPNPNPEPEHGAGKGAGWEERLLNLQIMAYRDLTSIIGKYMDVLQRMINAYIDWVSINQVFEIITRLAAAREQMWDIGCLSKDDDDRFQDAVERFKPDDADEELMW